MRRQLMQFCSDKRGTIAVIFALCLIPLMGFLAVAVDYTRASSLKSLAQSTVDSAALAAVTYNSDSSSQLAVDQVKAELLDKVGGDAQNLSVVASWLSATDFQVIATAQMPMTIMQSIPGMPSSIPVSSQAVARIYDPVIVSQSPNITQLDPEAGDYNRIYAYCYDQTKKDDPTTHGRSNFVAISDNGGTHYNVTMPSCNAGETISYRLLNVRNSRTTPSNWDRSSVEHYNYYTDTQMIGTKQTFSVSGYDKNGNLVQNGRNVPILESIICDTESQCLPKDQGGILPNNHETGRTPATATGSCLPGKLMYFGWEDRPPINGWWTDTDYDDIRIVVQCPTVTSSGSKVVRLIQ